MNVIPSQDEFLALSKSGNVVPVYTDLMADFETPVSVYAKLSPQGPSFLMESIEGGATLHRYSFIGYNPRKIFEVHWDYTLIRERGGEATKRPTPADPLSVIDEEMRTYQPVRSAGLPRFLGGAVGYIGYEYIHAVEPTVPLAEKNSLQMPVLHFMLTDTVVIFDRANQTLRLLINAHIEDNAKAAYGDAVASLESLYSKLQRTRSVAPTAVVKPIDIALPTGNCTRAQYESMVDKSKEYIRAGDVIQVVISQRFSFAFPHPPLDLYRALRTVNPSPYMFIYEVPEFALVGASPEVHVRLTDGLAETRPIAGSRLRGSNVDEDLALEKELLADEKERAEHLMLVDLSRNDLGRISEFGTVTVPQFMVVERYSHVMHIVSQVEGRTVPGKSAYDLMRATFPAGTVSGAPKIRAMQIIAELEREQRGPYAGAFGYFSYDGNHDSCIILRTALLKDGQIFIQSGAGLVADSQPDFEYNETLIKARAMLTAATMARGVSTASS